jgi:hypothetical protein
MLSRSTTLTKAQRWRRGAAVGTGLALITGLAATKAGPFAADASSHREAPLIAGDPRADNTDLYAFVSPDAPNSVTLIANWIPFEEPNGGPNFYTWADDTLYNIKIDNDGDARADLTYTWVFATHYRDGDGGTGFLSNTGQVTSLNDLDLNLIQTYDFWVTNEHTHVRTPLLGNLNGTYDATDPISAPSIAGAASMPDYKPLRDQAIYNIPGGGKTYSGQADDPFFLDLRVFDLLYGANATEVGQDTLAGFNVNAIALQLPKSAVAINNDATRNPVIGVWSTTDRRSAQVSGDTAPDNQFVQVSRLGNPLVNEVVIPLKYKDAFNAIAPDVDHTLADVVAKVEHPTLAALIEKIYKVPKPTEPRNDLTEIFLQGISKANAGLSGVPAEVLNVNLNSQDLNADARTARGNVDATPGEMLRLNMSVPPAANPNSYGVLAGDVAGFPNGRRLTDDVLDIAVQAVEGAAQSGQLVTGLLGVDSVDRNDRDFLPTFPYLALPHVDAGNLGTERSPRAPELISINPVRVLETRTDVGGQIGYTGAQPAKGTEVKVKVIGGGLAPDGTSAVYLNVTAVNSASSGFVTVYPCLTTRPTASAFNPLPTQVTHNLVVSKVGTDGNVCIYTSEPTDLVADLTAYHPANSEYKPVQPERLLETRVSEVQKGYAGAKPADGSTIELKVTGVGTANVPADATAVMLNVTADNSSAAGWVTVWPCGATRPNTSNVNLLVGAARANLVAAKIGAGGKVCLYANKSTDLIADIEGFSPSSSSFVPTVPERLLETRIAEGQVGYSGSKPRGGQTIELRVTGVGTAKVPADAGSVFLNVTATESNPGGFVTVFPCGSPRPLASNLNLTGVDTPNLVAAKIGEGGRVCIYTSNDSHFVADLAGYFPDTNLVGS